MLLSLQSVSTLVMQRTSLTWSSPRCGLGGVDGGEGNGGRGGERGQSPPAFMKLMPCKILQLYCFLNPVGTVVFHAINIFLQCWQL